MESSPRKTGSYLELLPNLVESFVTDIRNMKSRLDALEDRESTRALNDDRVRIIELEKQGANLADTLQTLAHDMENIKARLSALEEREGTRSLNYDRVRIIELEKRCDQLSETLSRLQPKG